MSATVTYKGSTLTTVDNTTRTLQTAGKYMEDNVTITDVTSGGGGGGNEDAIIERTITSIYRSNLSRIGSYAFYYCSALTTASFPAATSIGAYAFGHCSALTTASFPAATTISSGAFYYCSALTTASFPAATTISAYAFGYCRALTTASFPAVTTIGTSAFDHCSALTTASFPAATSIGSSAFYYCSALTTASFPVCSYVSNYAFRSCYSLKTVSFPALRSNSGFSWGTFIDCSALESVYLLGSVVGKATRSDVFQSTPLSASSYLGYFGSIYVRQSLLTAWQTATVWTLYSSRFVGLTDAEIEALG